MLVTKKIDGVWRQVDAIEADPDVKHVGRGYGWDVDDDDDPAICAVDTGQLSKEVEQVVDGGPALYTGERILRKRETPSSEFVVVPVDHEDPAWPPPDGMLYAYPEDMRIIKPENPLDHLRATTVWPCLVPRRVFGPRKGPPGYLSGATHRPQRQPLISDFEPYATLAEWGDASNASACLDYLRLLGLPSEQPEAEAA